MNEQQDIGFFPLLIQYKGSESATVVNSREEIESGKSFHVLEVNYAQPA